MGRKKRRPEEIGKQLALDSFGEVLAGFIAEDDKPSGVYSCLFGRVTTKGEEKIQKEWMHEACAVVKYNSDYPDRPQKLMLKYPWDLHHGFDPDKYPAPKSVRGIAH
jgi:hypothetical protein